jgi:nitroimidazol reductase NimA-like FMN-containing flavoprotein (pyridoxamine 5'-phosphate oxidase superfamily)
MVDNSWGVTPPRGGLRVRTNDSLEERAAARAKAREARAGERSTLMAGRMEARAALRERETLAREAERAARREAEEAAAAKDPHAAAKRHRTSGRKDVVREQRDTRGYTTVVDEGRIRELSKRGASLSGLAAAFGITAEEVGRILATAEE